MSRATIKIDRKAETVWAFFTKPANWTKWHERAVMKEVSPGWQKGATITWDQGPISTIRSFSTGKTVEIESPYISTTFSFTPLKGGATSVDVDFAPRGGATFNDGGMAHEKTVNAQLSRLKQCIESETSQDLAVNHEKLESTTRENKANIQKKWWQLGR